MLGDAKREAPGRFLQLNEDFEFAGRWEKDLGKMALNCDFWWQSRHSVMSPGNG
jgi:selenium-binding protein 1